MSLPAFNPTTLSSEVLEKLFRDDRVVLLIPRSEAPELSAEEVFCQLGQLLEHFRLTLEQARQLLRNPSLLLWINQQLDKEAGIIHDLVAACMTRFDPPAWSHGRGSGAPADPSQVMTLDQLLTNHPELAKRLHDLLMEMAECPICLEKPQTQFNSQCGHGACADCAPRLSESGKCHLCRGPIPGWADSRLPPEEAKVEETAEATEEPTSTKDTRTGLRLVTLEEVPTWWTERLAVLTQVKGQLRAKEDDWITLSTTHALSLTLEWLETKPSFESMELMATLLGRCRQKITTGAPLTRLNHCWEHYLKRPDLILRVLAAWNGQKAEPDQEVNLKLPNPARKLIMKLLQQIPQIPEAEEQMLRHSGKWKALSSVIHPFDRRFNKNSDWARHLFGLVVGNGAVPKFPSPISQMELTFATSDPVAFFRWALHNSGLAFRNMRRALKAFPKHADWPRFLPQFLAQLKTEQLIQLDHVLGQPEVPVVFNRYGQFCFGDDSPPSEAKPKAGAGRGKAKTAREKAREAVLRRRKKKGLRRLAKHTREETPAWWSEVQHFIQQELEARMIRHRQTGQMDQSVLVLPPVLGLMDLIRLPSGPETPRVEWAGVQPVQRGSQVLVPHQMIFGISWHNGMQDGLEKRTDLDLSLGVFDETGNLLAQLSYQQTRTDWAIHTGDLVTAPLDQHPATELAICDLERLREIHPTAKYLAAFCLSYSDTSLDTVKDPLVLVGRYDPKSETRVRVNHVEATEFLPEVGAGQVELGMKIFGAGRLTGSGKTHFLGYVDLQGDEANTFTMANFQPPVIGGTLNLTHQAPQLAKMMQKFQSWVKSGGCPPKARAVMEQLITLHSQVVIPQLDPRGGVSVRYYRRTPEMDEAAFRQHLNSLGDDFPPELMAQLMPEMLEPEEAHRLLASATTGPATEAESVVLNPASSEPPTEGSDEKPAVEGSDEKPAVEGSDEKPAVEGSDKQPASAGVPAGESLADLLPEGAEIPAVVPVEGAKTPEAVAPGKPRLVVLTDFFETLPSHALHLTYQRGVGGETTSNPLSLLPVV